MSGRPRSPTIDGAHHAPIDAQVADEDTSRRAHIRQPRLKPREGANSLISTTKRRLASLASASALIAMLAVTIVPGAALAAVNAVTPSTNDFNRAERLGARRCDCRRRLGDAHLHQHPGVHELLRVPHRRRSEPEPGKARAELQPLGLDGLYPFVCVNNTTKTTTIPANDYIEVRMVFGAEADERFDWTEFDVPQPKCKPTGFRVTASTSPPRRSAGPLQATSTQPAATSARTTRPASTMPTSPALTTSASSSTVSPPM